EAEGTAGMDDRRNDGRGARMASEGGGHGSDQRQHGLHHERIQSKRSRLNCRTMSDARSRGFAQRTQRPAEPPPAQAKEAAEPPNGLPFFSRLNRR
ncbi:MAG: hypothetical protein KDA99_07860, partial [Planctomycetales bacterium]|nr:hypothetical protein [Planctomycetales bacterium]